jgi:hypothetical protein
LQFSAYQSILSKRQGHPILRRKVARRGYVTLIIVPPSIVLSTFPPGDKGYSQHSLGIWHQMHYHLMHANHA